MIDINIMEDVLEEKYWQYTPAEKHLSGHCYRNSPFESDNNCGNCDGARCDYCEEYTINEHLEFIIYTDELCKLLESKGVPYEHASEIAYSDFCRNNTSGGYHLIYPNRFIFERMYPDEYKKLCDKMLK